MTDKYLKKSRGFTLVELSIVIIIIGFLIAGIAAGQSLIKQSQLNALVNDFTKFTTAINAFENRYGYEPGDFPNAYQYWGAVGGCTDTDVNTGSNNGCNGNGNGDLSADGVSQDIYEGMLMWKQLGLAGLINGNYSGLYPASTAVFGVDLPAGPFSNSGYYAIFDNYYGLVSSQDMIIFGSTVSGTLPYGSILKPADAKSIDLKLDDGFPSTGKFISGTSPVNSNGTCSNGTGGEDAFGATEYSLNNDNIACRMLYLYSQ